MIKLRKLFFIMITGITLSSNISSDEGMWTLDNLPKKNLEEKYNFKITDKWLKNAQLASVRFNDGGSGAFVSQTGLVLTNHHVAMGQLQKMSTKKSQKYISHRNILIAEIIILTPLLPTLGMISEFRDEFCDEFSITARVIRVRIVASCCRSSRR